MTPLTAETNAFVWKCREVGCGTKHLVYKDHITHVVQAHGLLLGKITATQTKEIETMSFSVSCIGKPVKVLGSKLAE